MVWSRACVIILACSSLAGATRVSRIKPGFQPQRGERAGNTRYMGGSGGLSGPSDTQDSSDSESPATETSPVIPQGAVKPRTHLEPQTPREATTDLLATSNPKVCEKPYSCLNCSVYRLCIPTSHGLTEYVTGSCPPERPYCDSYSGTCVNSVAAAVRCAQPDGNFRCMRDGQFPHPSDPSKYYICNEHKAYGYTCRDGSKYYAPSQSCSKFPWIASNPFHCDELNGTKVVYNNGGSFFAYCVNGMAHIVSNCAETEFFNSTSQVCEPQCSSEFVVADSNNCMKFFKCSKNPRTYSYERESIRCPDSEGFHPLAKKCISLHQLPNCKGDSESELQVL